MISLSRNAVIELKPALTSYIVEYARPERCDLKRIGFAGDRLMEFFGAERDIESLTRHDIRGYRAKRLTDGVTDSTIRRELVVLRRVVGHAEEEERISVVPAIKLPPESAPRERWFTEDEAKKIMEQPMSKRLHIFLHIAFGTGARMDAIETLEVGRVDLDGDFIDFRDPRRKISKKRRVKTSIVDWLKPVLAEACAGKAPTDLVMGPGSSIGPEFKRVLAKAGISEKGVRCHSIRRSFIMWSLVSGAKLLEVAAAVGDSLTTLERSYISINATQARGATSTITNPTGEQQS